MSKKKDFKTIDLFAGIGGIRLGFKRAGFKTVYANDYDRFCKITYDANFKNTFLDDTPIENLSINKLPYFDVLLAGFPCQPFSVAGVSKKQSLGRPHGFLDKTQGTLFFNIAQILKNRKPKAFMLENVKNLQSHDGGKTFKIITMTLSKLGYRVFFKVIDARYLVPQHRERIYIVGFRNKSIKFKFPELNKNKRPLLKEILEQKVDTKYTLSNKLWAYLRNYSKIQKKRGNGFGHSVFKGDDIARTLSARYYKDGSEILIFQKNKNPRKLIPREAARLMGFPDSFKIPVSDTQAYKQFGNSVVTPVVELIAKQIYKRLA